MIYLFIPAFNEEESLPKLLPKIRNVLEEHQMDYRLLVVNDGSRDRTQEILEEFVAAGMPLEVLRHPINRGLGETERDGFEFVAQHTDPDDIIVRVEGDDTHDPMYTINLINKVKEGYDVVNTSRFQPGGGQLGLNSYRKFISRAANLFMALMFGIKGMKDYSCGFRAYRARVLQDAIKIYGNGFIQLGGLGFTSTLETVVKLNLLGCRFAEVPFVLRYDLKESESKMVGSLTMLGYLSMAGLYHWPWGGWKRQYRGLRKLYKESPEQAIEKYTYTKLRRSAASKIGG